MVLSSHALAGAAVISMFPNNIPLGICLAFASHFVLDAIPHWDYELRSQVSNEEDPLDSDMLINKDFIIDISKILLDMLIGLLLSILIFSIVGKINIFILILGIGAAVLPDALQFVYWKFRHEPLTTLQRFHLLIHSKNDFKSKPVLGMPIQIAIISIVVWISRLF